MTTGLNNLRQEFAEEMGDIAHGLLAQLERWRASPHTREELHALQRGLHTIKGSAGLLELRELADLCHLVEDVLEPYQSEDAVPARPELVQEVAAALSLLPGWLQSLRTPGVTPPDLSPAMERLRLKADPGAPRVTRLFNRVPATDRIEGLAPAPASLEEPPPRLPPPPEAGDQDMVSTLLDLLTREEKQDPRRAARPPSTKVPSPLGFETPAQRRRVGPSLEPSQDPTAPFPPLTHTPRSMDRPPSVDRPSPGRPLLVERPAVVNPVAPADRGAPSAPPPAEDPSSLPPDPVLLPTRPASRRTGLSPATLVDDRHETPPASLPGRAPALTPVNLTTVPTRGGIAEPPQGGQGPVWHRVTVGQWPEMEQDVPRIGEPSSGQLRVEVEKLDALLDLVGELLQEKHRHGRLVEHLELEGSEEAARQAGEVNRRLSLRLGELKDAVVRMRMTPVHSVFRRYPGLVEDLARSLGREVELTIQGEDAELDRTVTEALFEPLVHLLRNAVDHGIEPPTERLRRGKPRRGQLTLSASREGSHMIIEVMDDGRGIDPARVASRALAQGLVKEERLREMNERERLDLIFLPGMTSAAEVTETSGRGMGMDTVRAHLKRIGGRIEIDSRPGDGTRIRLLVPLTLAIIQVVLVKVGPLRFGLPASAILELGRGTAETLHRTDRGWLYRTASGLYQAASLAALLGLQEPPELPRRVHVAVLGSADRRFAVWADRFEGMFECVIKPLSVPTTTISGLLGGTATGTGDPTLVLDPAALTEALDRR